MYRLTSILRNRHIKPALLTLLVLTLALPFPFACAQNPDFDEDLKLLTRPHAFNMVKWEVDNILSGAFHGGIEVTRAKIDMVLDFFAREERIEDLEFSIQSIATGDSRGDAGALQTELERLRKQNAEIAASVEIVIEKQIRDVLTEQGIFNPVGNLKIGFPPVNFTLDTPPHLLVVSPRDSIESMREILLEQALTVEEMEAIEESVDGLGVSSLVVNLGGIASYPSFVTNRSGLRFALEAAAEEWVHQYLFFKPLGLLFLLDLSGIARNYEIATINETVASMFGTEIGGIIYERYYSGGGEGARSKAKTGFDFNREMRNIRRNVDRFLARGEIELAEEYMAQKRKYLEQNGYYIRKLNQAYFAFHGTYADSPTSISPIGTELRDLRSQSSSLKEFLDTAALLSSRQQLTEIARP